MTLERCVFGLTYNEISFRIVQRGDRMVESDSLSFSGILPDVRGSQETINDEGGLRSQVRGITENTTRTPLR